MCDAENVNTASGRVLSVDVTVPAVTEVPSPQSTVSPSVSSQPGSVTVAVIVTCAFSSDAGVVLTTVDGAAFVTVTVAVSVSDAPYWSVTRTATVYEPS